MEAIIKSSGQQFKVTEGATIEVDYQDVEPGSTIEFPDVLYIGGEGSEPKVGSPTLPGAKVVGTVLGPTKGPKLVVAHFRRRKNSRRRVGHRQKYIQVKIDRIEL
mgnify:CR=1 FL=1